MAMPRSRCLILVSQRQINPSLVITHTLNYSTLFETNATGLKRVHGTFQRYIGGLHSSSTGREPMRKQ